MPLLSSLSELKKILSIDPANDAEDAALLFYLEYASAWIAELLNRPGLFLKLRTEVYSGTNTQRLLLRSRPVYTTPTIQVYYDSQAYYGAASGAWQGNNEQLNWGSDFTLQVDQEDGSSRSGILIRINNVWPKFWARQAGWLTPFVIPDIGSIKVIYLGGYTVDQLPATLRFACNQLAAKIRYLMPLGVMLSAESYEERNISIIGDRKDYLLAGVKDLILSYRNWTF